MMKAEHDKYARLIRQIDDLETRISDLDKELCSGSDIDESNREVMEQELKDLRQELAGKQNELARVSDGCGKPHSM